MDNSSTKLTIKNRILIFSIAYDPFIGGAEVAVKEITKRISDYEFDLVTLNLDSKQKKLETLGNVNVHRLDTSKLLFPFKAFLLGAKLHKERKYKAVWSIMANYSGFAALFFKMRFPRVKFILTLQEFWSAEEMKRRVRYISFLHKEIFYKADVIQVISRYLYDLALETNPGADVVVIPNGVDAKLFSEVSKDKVKELSEKLDKKPNSIFLITTSRLTPKNGLPDVIKALAILPQNIYFIILGMGELEEPLKDLARSFVVEERVKFVGFVPYEEIPAYLKASDIFIRTPLSEGFGNSFVEAMAAEIPVIATPVGGIVDFVLDGETGVFAAPQDPESIAHAVMSLIENKELVTKIVGNASRMAKDRYDWELIAKEMKSKVFE